MANITIEQLDTIGKITLYAIILPDNDRRIIGVFFINKAESEFSLEFFETISNEQMKELFRLIEPLYNDYKKKD